MISRAFATAALVILATILLVRVTGLPVVTGAWSAVLVPERVQSERLQARAEADFRAGGVSPATLDAARAHALRQPLDALPQTVFLLAARGEAAETSPPSAARHAAMALKLQPRQRGARRHLIEQSIASGAYAAALDQLTVLYDADPRHADTYVEIILSMADRPDSWPALRTAIAMDPPWTSAVLDAIASRDVAYADLFGLFRDRPERLATLLASMVERGDVAEAHLAFLSSIDIASGGGLTVPYNPTFGADTAAPPFNWTINTRHADSHPDGGLSASYFGRGYPEFARQLVSLSPGEYTLSTTVQAEHAEARGGLTLTLSCLGTNEEITSLRVSTPPTDPAVFARDFTHDEAGCDYQTLVLTGQPGAIPRAATFRIGRVDIHSAGTLRRGRAP